LSTIHNQSSISKNVIFVCAPVSNLRQRFCFWQYQQLIDKKCCGGLVAMYRFGTSTATIQLSRIRHVFRPALSKALNLDSNLHKRIQQPADAMAKTQIARLVIRVYPINASSESLCGAAHSTAKAQPILLPQ
jgi:hypothetical protein